MKKERGPDFKKVRHRKYHINPDDTRKIYGYYNVLIRKEDVKSIVSKKRYDALAPFRLSYPDILRIELPFSQILDRKVFVKTYRHMVDNIPEKAIGRLTRIDLIVYGASYPLTEHGGMAAWDKILDVRGLRTDYPVRGHKSARIQVYTKDALQNIECGDFKHEALDEAERYEESHSEDKSGESRSRGVLGVRAKDNDFLGGNNSGI
jgi:hypothetical protein